MESIYESIAARTGGNIYIGVVGPVRTGKSTLIKRIMEQLVIPNIEDPYRRERARDELPQSGSGRIIMTSEPKFVPEEAVRIAPEGASMGVRFIDSVGYMVEGAVGAEDESGPRMVTTPWCDREIPMTEAAEIGTKKVMEDHCSIGLVVTTDGTVTDIPRQDYLEAESCAIRDMAATGKPFLVIINSRVPGSETAAAAARHIREEFGLEPMVADCQTLDEEGIGRLFRELLYAFPMKRLCVRLPRWMDALEWEHPIKKGIYDALLENGEKITGLGTVQQALIPLMELESVSDLNIRETNLAAGTVSCVVTMPEALFYRILSSRTGMEIRNDGQLLELLTKLSAVKAEYDKIADALSQVQATGYGVVLPDGDQMKLEKPEIVRKGSTYGVKLRAGAPSIHMIRVDIDTQISPMVGDEKQSRDLMEYLSSEDPDKLWQSNIFGKSVYEMIREGLNAKLNRMPQEVRGKFRGSLTRIVNDGANGLICLIL